MKYIRALPPCPLYAWMAWCSAIWGTLLIACEIENTAVLKSYKV
jgi:hypothetical protein